MIEEHLSQLELCIQKAIDVLKVHLSKIRTGRANPDILQDIQVEYYGNLTPLAQVASVVVEDNHVLKVTPWEKKIVPDIERAIVQSDIGLNPTNQGDFIRIIFPPLNEERRKALIKLAYQEGEHIKVSIRSFRRDTLDKLKKMVKEKIISEDDEKQGKQKIEKITAQYIDNADQILLLKEKDLIAL